MVKLAQAELDATFAALSDPTRRAMIERLARGESTVTKLAEPFDVSLPAISKHLRVLERAGLIERRKEGRVHRLSIRPAAIEDAAGWIESQRAFWESRLDSLAGYLQTEKEG